jgi:excisionase family DNA binding protein
VTADGPEWLTPAEAAELWRVHVRTVYDAVAAGELPHVRIGRAIRISRSALERAAVPDAEPGTVLDNPTAANDGEVSRDFTPLG